MSRILAVTLVFIMTSIVWQPQAWSQNDVSCQDLIQYRDNGLFLEYQAMMKEYRIKISPLQLQKEILIEELGELQKLSRGANRGAFFLAIKSVADAVIRVSDLLKATRSTFRAIMKAAGEDATIYTGVALYKAENRMDLAKNVGNVLLEATPVIGGAIATVNNAITLEEYLQAKDEIIKQIARFTSHLEQINEQLNYYDPRQFEAFNNRKNKIDQTIHNEQCSGHL